MKHFHNTEAFGVAITIFTAFAFGFYPPIARLVYLDGANPTFMILATVFARALGMLIACKMTGQKLYMPRSIHWPLLTAGILQCVTMVCMFFSIMFLPGPVVIIIVFSYTIFLLLFLMIKGERKFDMVTIMSAVVALLGLALVVDLWSNLNVLKITGILLAFAAAFSDLFKIYILEHQLKSKPPTLLGAQVLSIATLFCLLLIPTAPPVPPTSSIGYIGALVACLTMAIANLAMFVSIAKIGAFQYSMLSKLEPIFTAILSVLIVRDILTVDQYIGMAIVIISLVYFQSYETKRKKAITNGV